MKTCTICGETKPDGAFHWDDKEHKYLSSRCRECHRKYKREWRWKTPEKYRASRREYKSKHASAIRKYAKQYAQKNQEKVKGRRAVATALRNGQLIIPAVCEVCGRERKLVGHHPDYNKPLEVMWLCSECHQIEHGRCKPREVTL